MSLILNISAEEFDRKILFSDCTGLFSGTNQGGYGANNGKINDVIDSYIEVTNPNGDVKKIDLYPNVPNQSSTPIEIEAGMLGMKSLESGKYTIKYTVVYSLDKIERKAFTFTEVFCIEELACCIDKKVKQISFEKTNSLKTSAINELSNMFEFLKYSIDCGLLNNATKISDYLKEQCKCCNC